MRGRIGRLVMLATAFLALLATGPIARAGASVTIEAPANGTLTNNPAPRFAGSADSLGDAVTLAIHAGASAEGTLVQAPTTAGPPLSGSWEVTPAALTDGTYTAVAEQGELGGLGESAQSEPVTFTVDTTPPAVSLNAVASPSAETEPTLSGAGGEAPGDDGTVSVAIFSGSREVASASAGVSEGTWSYTSPHLADGAYTAQARQSDAAGNEGASAVMTFTVDTTSPSVTLNQPRSPSNDTTPSFSGTASDTTQVLVRIYEGSKAEGTVVSTASAAGNGAEWKSDEASPALADGEYTAVAVQTSSLGNPAGVSGPVMFTVDTGPPHVTLEQPETPSNDTTPSFTGTASDTMPIVIEIYAGSSAEGPAVATAAATGTGSGWTSGQASPALATGEYTAVATQESSLLGNPAGSSVPVSFFVDTRSPTVALNQPPTPSNDVTPTFSGSASAATKVVVHILSATKTEVASATATPSGGTWTASNEGDLADGTYTAFATQESPLGNPPGMSNEVTFTINTAPPTVMLNQPAGRSNDTTPSFTGSASDTTAVTVLIYKGAKAEGTPASSATAAGTGAEFSSGPASPALANGEYTAIAKQPSSLGNPEGKSAPVKFIIDTSAPRVELNAPPKVSNETKPFFMGTASDTTTVTVQIFKGTEAKGTVVASATAAGSGGAWTSGRASPELEDGVYTAIAKQPSSLGNPEGVSEPVTFTINTKPPTVTLNSPSEVSNNTTPSFTGTASDTTQVTVSIYAGNKAEGAVVSSAAASGTGAGWSSGKASPALANGQYTAVATQPSSIGNEAGKSAPVTFEVDTTPPKVTITTPLNGSVSNNRTPSFSGTASDTTQVTVKIYEGTEAKGSAISEATASVVGGSWKSTGATPALAPEKHTYTAVATQASSLGNPQGESAPVIFHVDTLPPAVTLDSPPRVSNKTNPSFTGTASDTTSVTVQIFKGTEAKGTVVASATAPGTGGAWASSAASPALVNGTYTAIARQPSSLGNPAGVSAPVTFKVDTNAPTVVLNALGPRINDPTPSFTGTASDKAGGIIVEIFAGPSACDGCKPISTAAANATGGGWSSGEASPALADGEYAAVATQQSSIGNSVGVSESIRFVLDTLAPAVTLTEPSDGSSGPGDSRLVKGRAGTDPHDLALVTAQLFAGASIAPGQTPLQSIAVKAVDGNWSATFGGLAPGSYTVRAEQSDDAGNVGRSSASSFTVTQTVGAAAAHPPAPPTASFTVFPSRPRVGEPVSLASSSTDPSSPIIAYAWDLAGNGSFVTGSPGMSTSFATPGNHTVQLRATDANGLSSVAAATIPVDPARMPLMQPFPLVRIASTAARSGVRLRLLSVLASPGARISVLCKGRGCPLKSQSHLAAAGKKGRAFVEFRRFERALRAGVILEIRVSRAGEVGKYTRLRVRRRRLPLRTDACLAGVATKPIVCPAS